MAGDVELVEVVRGGFVESAHAGAVAVSDADGRLLVALGDVGRPIYPRSAVKAIQALPLVESGAAAAYGFGPAELALACASHNGEARHVETAAAMLAAAGRDGSALECGAQWPDQEADRGRLHLAGARPTALHNNCSGKHAGFVCLACHEGVDPAGYVEPDHPVQRRVARALGEVTGVDPSRLPVGTDGCSIPTYALPLDRLAHGFARMATGRGLDPTRAEAARLLVAAAMAEPFQVAGSGRFDTRLMEAFPGRVFVKIGAEGVYCGALPEVGLGFALKVRDGAFRAAEVAAAALVARFLPKRAGDEERLVPFLTPKLVNWTGREVGGLRPTAVLTHM